MWLCLWFGGNVDRGTDTPYEYIKRVFKLELHNEKDSGGLDEGDVLLLV